MAAVIRARTKYARHLVSAQFNGSCVRHSVCRTPWPSGLCRAPVKKRSVVTRLDLLERTTQPRHWEASKGWNVLEG